MFEGYYSPPLYQDLYNFVQGAQNDIFVDSVVKNSSSLGQSGASSTPTIVDVKATTGTPVPTTSPSSSPSPASAYQSSPNEMNPSPAPASASQSSPNEMNPSQAPAHTSEPKPSQSHGSYDHHKHKHTTCTSEST